MNVVNRLHKMGVSVRVAGPGELALDGLSKLPRPQARAAVELARANKPSILAELSGPEWSALGIQVKHPGNGTSGELIRHRSGRLAIQRSDGVLLSVGQDMARGWVQ